jgi:hypothetical protein
MNRAPLAALLFALPLSTLLGGCATLFTGTSDQLKFDANVPGVRLTIDGQVEGQLPLSLDLSRSFVGGRQFTAKFEKDGYATQEFQLKREFNTAAILDISSTVVSGGVDVLTGSLMRFSPVDYHIEMVQAGPQTADQLRSTEGVRFALFNHRRLQDDLARGGGEHLEAFALLVGGGDEALARQVAAASLAAAPALVAVPTAPAFVQRFNAVLDEEPALRALRLE